MLGAIVCFTHSIFNDFINASVFKEKSLPLPSSPMNERTRQVACVSFSGYGIYFHERNDQFQPHNMGVDFIET